MREAGAIVVNEMVPCIDLVLKVQDVRCLSMEGAFNSGVEEK